MSVENITFTAKWNKTNKQLQEPLSTTDQKIRQIAWNIFSILMPVIGLARLICYAIGSLANKMTLPAAHSMPKERFLQAKRTFNAFWYGDITDKNKTVRAHFKAEPQTVITPDGAPLSATFIHHKDAQVETPIVIYFNGNFQLSFEADPWLLEQAIARNTPCNFMIFDYRGVGDSGGTFSGAKDLILDGASIVQWVQERIGTPAAQIHFYGLSLGGAVALQTQSLDPETFSGSHVNDRSFAHSDKMVEARFGSSVLSALVARIFRDQGYSADAAAAFQRLKGKKLVIYHPSDSVIPYSASLQNEVHHDAVIRLTAKAGGVIFNGEYATYETLSNRYHHSSDLRWHEGAVDQIAQFLLKKGTLNVSH